MFVIQIMEEGRNKRQGRLKIFQKFNLFLFFLFRFELFSAGEEGVFKKE